MEFEKNYVVEIEREEKKRDIEKNEDKEKKKELKIKFEEEERRIRMKYLGNIRFIGEILKLGMLKKNIMKRCIKDIIDEGDEE